MPHPSSTLATLSPDLSTFFEIEYASAEQNFIGTRVMPIMSVPKQAGTFGKVTVESLLEHSTSTSRSPNSGYNRRQYEFTSDSYTCEENGIEEVIDDREMAMYSDYIEAEAVATRRAVNLILMSHERRVAAAAAAITTTSPLGNGLWSVGTSTPIDDIETAYRAHRDATGIRPNALILSEYVFRTVRQHPDIVARVSSSGAGDQDRARDVNAEQLAAVFDIENVLVASGIENTANPNQPAVLTDIWTNEPIVTRIASTNDIREPCFGRTFHWSEDGSVVGGRIESYRDEAIRGSIVRVRHDTDEKVLYPELGIRVAAAI